MTIYQKKKGNKSFYGFGASLNVCMYVCIYALVYVHMYVCLYVCVCTYVYIF